MPLRGLLADQNIQGHLTHIQQRLERVGILEILEGFGLRLVTFRDLGLAVDIEDRPLWHFCQEHGWVLLTDDRNDDGPSSLQRTIEDGWRPGNFPVLTLASKDRFENVPEYVGRTSEDLATVLFDLLDNGHLTQQPRIYVPFQWP
jgi:hypothetical protein